MYEICSKFTITTLEWYQQNLHIVLVFPLVLWTSKYLLCCPYFFIIVTVSNYKEKPENEGHYVVVGNKAKGRISNLKGWIWSYLLHFLCRNSLANSSTHSHINSEQPIEVKIDTLRWQNLATVFCVSNNTEKSYIQNLDKSLKHNFVELRLIKSKTQIHLKTPYENKILLGL